MRGNVKDCVEYRTVLQLALNPSPLAVTEHSAYLLVQYECWPENNYTVHKIATAILAFALPLFISVRVLRYHSSCHYCSHLAITFKFMAAKILYQRWKIIISRIPPHKIKKTVGSLVTKL